MQWYYAEDNKQVGPFSDEDFKDLTSSGKVTAETLVWHEGMPQWAAYGSLSGPAPEIQSEPADAAAKAAPAAPDGAKGTGTCVECGKEFPLEDMIQYEHSTVCAECKPTFFQRLQEGASVPGTMDYGGFWIRFAAKFLDGIIMSVVNTAVSFIATALGVAAAQAGSPEAALGLQMIVIVIQLCLRIAYDTFFVGKFGATPGKMACKLQVVRSDGSKLTYGRALGRHFGEWVTGLTLTVGYIIAAFDDEKRTLHDRICDTRVIKKS
jgi:uncharacterized RDD family membrane protein YckC